MKKAALTVSIIGLILFAVGFIVIVVTFSQTDSEENSLEFDKKVTAQITNTRMIELDTEQSQNNNSSGHRGDNTAYRYYVEFLVSDDSGTYTKEQGVSGSLYSEYNTLEKNKDMEFNMYVNPDGAQFLSLKDLEGANAEYLSGGHIAKNIAVRIIASAAGAFLGICLLSIGKWLKKRAY